MPSRAIDAVTSTTVGRPWVALERHDRLVLLRGGAIGVVARDRNAVLLRERRDALAVVHPVGRERDHVQAPFLLRRCDQLCQVLLGAAERWVRERLLPRRERGFGQRDDGETCCSSEAALQQLAPPDPLLLEPSEELVLLLLEIFHGHLPRVVVPSGDRTPSAGGSAIGSPVVDSPWRADGEWLRAALHAHSTSSDGELAPRALARHYARAGYDVVALTDHWHRSVAPSTAGARSSFRASS